jgi:hypothetical protein
MSWQAQAREVAQRAGLDPRYLRRWRWLHKAAGVRRTGQPVHRHLRFVLTDPEPDNYSYALANVDELCHWVEEVSGAEPERVRAVMAEPDADAELWERLRWATRAHRWWSKPLPPFGRRVGWYALVRLLAPALAVETGVHDGLGALLILRALERNATEGHEGRLVSFDINPAAGWLVGADPRWQLRIESSREGLESVLADHGPVGMFIHDSLHTYENEVWELRTAAARLAPRGVLISDNAHATPALGECCREFGLRYHEFTERPRNHFYPGGKLGAGSLPPSTSR